MLFSFRHQLLVAEPQAARGAKRNLTCCWWVWEGKVREENGGRQCKGLCKIQLVVQLFVRTREKNNVLSYLLTTLSFAGCISVGHGLLIFSPEISEHVVVCAVLVMMIVFVVVI